MFRVLVFERIAFAGSQKPEVLKTHKLSLFIVPSAVCNKSPDTAIKIVELSTTSAEIQVVY